MKFHLYSADFRFAYVHIFRETLFHPVIEI